MTSNGEHINLEFTFRYPSDSFSSDIRNLKEREKEREGEKKPASYIKKDEIVEKGRLQNCKVTRTFVNPKK